MQPSLIILLVASVLSSPAPPVTMPVAVPTVEPVTAAATVAKPHLWWDRWGNWHPDRPTPIEDGLVIGACLGAATGSCLSAAVP